MSEARPTRILGAVMDRLRSIVSDGGDTYWYTPQRVARARGFHEDFLDASVGAIVGDAIGRPPAVIYLLVPGARTVEGDTNQTSRATLRLEVWAAILYDERKPLEAVQPDAPVLQERLARDVELALNAGDQTLSNVPTISCRVVNVEQGPEATYVAGWAVVALSVEIFYVYRRADP